MDGATTAEATALRVVISDGEDRAAERRAMAAGRVVVRRTPGLHPRDLEELVRLAGAYAAPGVCFDTAGDALSARALLGWTPSLAGRCAAHPERDTSQIRR